MKITKPEGLGRFGLIIEDFDFASIEAWQELKELNLQHLVVYVKGNSSFDNFKDIAKNAPILGRNRRTHEAMLAKKYGPEFYKFTHKWDEVDRMALRANARWAQNVNLPVGWHYVKGELDENGKSLGTFSGGQCLWHSNESGTYHFAPLVMLYGKQGMVGSSTGFCSSTDWYERQTESFRSELDELVAIHDYKPYSISPDGDNEHEAVMRRNFFLEGGAEIPLVIKSPGGIKGLHFTYSTTTNFKGMSVDESEKLMKRLIKELYTDEYIWNAWWQNNTGDILLFDNTIVTHNRTVRDGLPVKELLSERVAIRSSWDYRNNDYKPFYQEEYNQLRKNYTDSIFRNSDGFDKYYARKMIESLDDTERQMYISRYTAEQLAEILAYDIHTADPQLSRFV
jgi:alpha-ketoglutarate-dependent taurine dioxygenase